MLVLWTAITGLLTGRGRAGQSPQSVVPRASPGSICGDGEQMRVPAMVMGAEAPHDDARIRILFKISDEGMFQAKGAADVKYLDERNLRVARQMVDVPVKAFWRPGQQPVGVQTGCCKVLEEEGAQRMRGAPGAARGMAQQPAREGESAMCAERGAGVEIFACRKIDGSTALDAADGDAQRTIKAEAKRVGSDPALFGLNGDDRFAIE